MNPLQAAIDRIEGTTYRAKAARCNLDTVRLHQLYAGKRDPMPREYVSIAEAAGMDWAALMSAHEATIETKEPARQRWLVIAEKLSSTAVTASLLALVIAPTLTTETVAKALTFLNVM